MAESTRTSNFRERSIDVCAEFLTQNVCNKLECSLLHRKITDVKILDNHEDDGYYTALPLNHSNRINLLSSVQRHKNPRPCRFYLRGNCNRLDNCHFSHELPTVQTNRYSPTRRGPKSSNSQNMPSTSTQITSVEPSASNEITAHSSDSESNNYMNSSSHEDASDGDNEGACSPSLKNNWVNAPEFVPSPPRPKSYAQALNPMDDANMSELSELRLCPYATKDGFCKYPPGECSNLHGDLCDLCGRAVMHPYNEELRKKHHQDCIKQHEKDMELSFALARSKEKSCGVCFEVIMEKAIGEQRFGILPNCNHCFCLTCIRKWRQARQFENKIIRACPECRITSDFVCPSMYWVDTKEDKDKLIDDYKKALSKKDCKYFKKGTGKCPFGNKCFYLHALQDGRTCDVGPPPRQRRRRRLETRDFDVLQQVILWDFLDDRDNAWQSLADDLEDLVSFFTDSDDSDWSDYEFFYD